MKTTTTNEDSRVGTHHPCPVCGGNSAARIWLHGFSIHTDLFRTCRCGAETENGIAAEKILVDVSFYATQDDIDGTDLDDSTLKLCDIATVETIERVYCDKCAADPRFASFARENPDPRHLSLQTLCVCRECGSEWLE